MSPRKTEGKQAQATHPGFDGRRVAVGPAFNPLPLIGSCWIGQIEPNHPLERTNEYMLSHYDVV